MNFKNFETGSATLCSVLFELLLCSDGSDKQTGCTMWTNGSLYQWFA